MVLSLKYGDLSKAISETKKLATELGQYCDDLSRKIQQKMYSVEGGSSSYLNNADYYVNSKINQLRKREDNANNLSSKEQTLLDTAKRVDTDVEKTIQANQKAFFKKNPDLKPSKVKLAFTAFMCDLKKVPILGDIIKGGEVVLGALDTLKNNIRYWWECGGGKELIMNCLDIVIKVGFAVLAVITAVAAVVALATATVITGGAILFAIAACTAAVISVVNAVTNTVTSVQAIVASQNGNPAMAKIYGERDTFAQVLRDTNFHNKFLNRSSMVMATAIEITDAVAGVVLLVASIGKVFVSIMSQNGVGFAFKELAKDKSGNLYSRITFKSLWNGTKALFLNQKLTTSTSAGLRTTLINNFKESFKYNFTLFKYALKDPIKWLKAKPAGNLGIFGNISKTIKDNFAVLRDIKKYSSLDGVEKLKYLKKLGDTIKFVNNGLSDIKLIIDGLSKTDNKGLIRSVTENLIQDNLFDNNFVKLINKSGIGYKILSFDRTDIIKDYTGISKGLLQKVSDINISIKTLGTETERLVAPFNGGIINNRDLSILNFIGPKIKYSFKISIPSLPLSTNVPYYYVQPQAI